MSSLDLAAPPEGVRFTVCRTDAARSRAVLLLDRDGVLAREVGYLHRVGDVRLQAGAAALVRAANQAGIAVAAVSNQSGIDRGMYGWADYETVEAEIARRLAGRGAYLDVRVACAYHPEHTPRWGETHAQWRKPGPGMLRLAVARLGARPKRSWMVGDMASDAIAARAAGLAGSVHLLSPGHGRGQRRDAQAVASPAFPVLIARTLAEAKDLLAEQGLFG